MTFNRSLFSSLRGDWETPADLMAALDAEFHFDRDVTDRENGLFDAFRDPWPKTVYANPPYGPGIKRWLVETLFQMKLGQTRIAVFLLPSRTDVRWFHDLILPNAGEIRFIRGRLKFGGSANSAPFPSMVVVFRS